MINKFLLGVIGAVSMMISYAQTDSCWTVLLTGKDKTPQFSENMWNFSKSGFYLYRNAIYEFATKNGGSYSGRLIDIKPDTLYITNFYNKAVAKLAGVELDTMHIYYKELDKLRLISDRSLGLYTEHSFDKLDFTFIKDTTRCSLPGRREQIFSNDSTVYELSPHLSDQGMEYLYEETGRTYYYQGSGLLRTFRPKKDTTYTVRNFIWYTPNAVEKINGVALGIYADNMKNDFFDERDSLKINGLNLELNPFGFIALMDPHLIAPFPDSIEYYNKFIRRDIGTIINGVSISGFFIAHEGKVQGANFTGGYSMFYEIHGLSISGISNFSYKFNGVSVAALYNRATEAKGLQIGLYNKSTNMRGVQIGLWNTNGRRSLPFINWQFRDKKKKQTH